MERFIHDFSQHISQQQRHFGEHRNLEGISLTRLSSKAKSNGTGTRGLTGSLIVPSWPWARCVIIWRHTSYILKLTAATLYSCDPINRLVRWHTPRAKKIVCSHAWTAMHHCTRWDYATTDVGVLSGALSSVASDSVLTSATIRNEITRDLPVSDTKPIIRPWPTPQVLCLFVIY